jgi:hypothetical protein
MNGTVAIERIASKIYFIRGTKVMLDRDLFPLTRAEIMSISQIVTSSRIKYAKRVSAYTEQGVAMLSGVLNSKRAILVNIQIMRTFTKLRRMMLDNEDLRQALSELKAHTDERFQIVFETLDQLLTTENNSRKKIGFTVKEQSGSYGRGLG